MAIGHRASIGAGLTTNQTSLTVVIPATVVSGDILILVTANRGATDIPLVLDTDITGNRWAQMLGANNTGRGDVWWKRATSATASTTVTVSGCTNSCSAVLSAFSGCLARGTPYEAASVQANASGTESHSAIETLGAGRWVGLAVVNLNNDNAVTLEDATDPDTITHLIQHLNTGGLDCATVIAAASQGAAGSTGTFTWAQTNGITVSVAFALIPHPTIIFLEPGSDATGDLSFYSATFGTVASATDQPGSGWSGLRTIKCSTGAGPTTARIDVAAALNDSGRRISFRFATDAIGIGFTNIMSMSQSGGNVVAQLAIAGSGNKFIRLELQGVAVYLGGTILLPNTQYYVTLSYLITNATTWRFDVYIDGRLELSKSSLGTLTNITTSLLRVRADNTANINSWFDDIYVDNGDDYTYPGNITISALPPTAENTTGFDTAIGNARSASDWNNVNEVPLSTVNGWQQAATADTQENYTVRTAAAAGLSAHQVIGRCAWIWAKGAAGGVGTPKIMDHGTETAIVLTASGKLFTVVTTSNDYPSAAAGIGMRATNNADDTFLYECGQIVAVWLADPPPARPRIILQALQRSATY